MCKIMNTPPIGGRVIAYFSCLPKENFNLSRIIVKYMCYILEYCNYLLKS